MQVSTLIIDPTIQDVVLHLLDKELSKQESDCCEGLLTLDEAIKALKLMASKSPSSDDLTKELYAKVWTLLGQDLVDLCI